MSNQHIDQMGLPAPQQRNPVTLGPAEAPSPERDGYEYVLPHRIMELPSWQRYGTQFTEADLSFVMCEPTTKDEDDATKFAPPNNMVAMMNRLEQLCLHRIGGRMVRRNQTLIDAWYKAIGHVGRKIVEATFLKLYQVDPAEVEGVLAAGKPVTV